MVRFLTFFVTNDSLLNPKNHLLRVFVHCTPLKIVVVLNVTVFLYMFAAL